MDWKSTALISGAGLLATWVFSMPDATAPVASSAASAARAPQASAAAIDIQREAARLQVRLHPDARVNAVARNPFQFASRAPRRVVPADSPPAVPAAALPAVAPIEQPPLSLDGIATDVVDGQEQRTAILHADGGVVLVKEGDMVSGRYRVMTVAPDAAELMDVPRGSVVRLVLR